MDQEKKMKAAVSAVLTYIKSEEEVAVSSGMIAPPVDTRQARVPGYWGLNGRMAQMNQRDMMQLKSFHRSCWRRV